MSSHAEGEVWEGGGKRYRMEKVVGNGAFGIVWRAKDLESGMQVAIKKVILDRRYHNRELQMYRRDILGSRMLSHIVYLATG